MQMFSADNQSVLGEKNEIQIYFYNFILNIKALLQLLAHKSAVRAVVARAFTDGQAGHPED